MHDWRRKGLIPLPTSVFLEFLPADEQPDPHATVLLDELEQGKLYEPVITSFYGMPFMRMRQGDLLRVTGHTELGLPLFEFHSRSDDIIDLGSIARINRATLVEALDALDVKEDEWTARKEHIDGLPVMCLYVRKEPEGLEDLRQKLHRTLGKIDPHYREAMYTLGYPLLRLYSTRADAVEPTPAEGYEETVSPSGSISD